jgi:D-sedoheptulose 7-phosphate isomerase
VVCLNDCIPLLTALANDEGYQNVFSAQLNNHVESGDLVIAISSSGNSPNVIKAIEVAKERGAKTWSWVGFDGGELMRKSDCQIYIPSKKGQYGFMEDITLVITHMLSVFIQEQDVAVKNDEAL